MAQRVVDGLEVVEVHEEHRGNGHAEPAALQGVLHTVLEEGAIGEACQVVIERLASQLGLECLALTDVANVQDDAIDIGVIQEVRELGLDLQPAAVGVTKLEFHGVPGDSLVLCHHVEARVEAGDVLRMDLV